jgi:hypothetical protein
MAMGKQVWVKRIYYDRSAPPRSITKVDYILQDKKTATDIVKGTHDGRARAYEFEYAPFHITFYRNTIKFFKNQYVIIFLVTLLAGLIVLVISLLFRSK